MRRTLPLPLLLLLATGCTRPPAGSPASAGQAAAVAPPAADTGAPAPIAPLPAAEGPAPAAPGGSTPVELDARFVPLIAAAFRDYRAWGRVDDELRWAPSLCRLPLPGRARMSAAADGGHARKLYSVLAKDHDRYPRARAKEGQRMPQPVGQVVVKESYHPEPVKGAEPPPALARQDQRIDGDHFNPYASDGKQTYHASRMAGVYVVLKVQEGTAGTDAGWVYGTVTPGGEVTSAGRVASCMGCHVTAPHERLFGLGRDSATPGLSP